MESVTATNIRGLVLTQIIRATTSLGWVTWVKNTTATHLERFLNVQLVHDCLPHHLAFCIDRKQWKEFSEQEVGWNTGSG